MFYGSDEHLKHIRSTATAITKQALPHLASPSVGHFVKGIIEDHLLQHDSVTIKERSLWFYAGLMCVGAALPILCMICAQLFLR